MTRQVPDWTDAPMPGYHWRPDPLDGPHAFRAAGDEWGAFIYCATCGEVRRIDPPPGRVSEEGSRTR